MPNYECTNYTLTGKKEDLERFAKAVNETKDIRPLSEQIRTGSFGRLWLGNFVAFVKNMNYEQLSEFAQNNRFWLRGIIILFGTEDIENPPKVKIDPDGKIRIGVDCAYTNSVIFERILEEDFNLKFAYLTFNEGDWITYIYDPENNLWTNTQLTISGTPENIQKTENYFKKFPKNINCKKENKTQLYLTIRHRPLFYDEKFENYIQDKFNVQITNKIDPFFD